MPYRERFRSVFQGVVDIISLTDTDYNILMVNTAYERLIQRPAKECIGQKCYSVLRGREKPCNDCPIIHNCEAYRDESELLVPIGDEKVSIRRHPVYDNTGKVIGIFEIGRIITKELMMQQELQHQGRLKIMGELATSIVHEIKNPLVGIGLMAASIMERMQQRKTKDEIYEDVEGILYEVKRLEKLLETLLDFGKPQIFLTQKADIHSIINTTLKLMEKKCNAAGISIKRIFNLKTPKIQVDFSKMQQVFLNILLNAVDAMPEGGEILIKTDISKRAGADEGEKDFIQIVIKDNGIGIKKEYLPYIFDPFYSKSSGRTGLGLSIVSRIIELHNGLITLKSEEGQGTIVEIYLPVD
ncbi:MAG: two-component system sensor histidine kinase NtrB [bacterium]